MVSKEIKHKKKQFLSEEDALNFDSNFSLNLLKISDLYNYPVMAEFSDGKYMLGYELNEFLNSDLFSQVSIDDLNILQSSQYCSNIIHNLEKTGKMELLCGGVIRQTRFQ